jgi:hypothetical protein
MPTPRRTSPGLLRLEDRTVPATVVTPTYQSIEFTFDGPVHNHLLSARAQPDSYTGQAHGTGRFDFTGPTTAVSTPIEVSGSGSGIDGAGPYTDSFRGRITLGYDGGKISVLHVAGSTTTRHGDLSETVPVEEGDVEGGGSTLNLATDTLDLVWEDPKFGEGHLSAATFHLDRSPGDPADLVVDAGNYLGGQLTYAAHASGLLPRPANPLTPVTDVRVYWASGATADTIIAEALPPVPVYWDTGLLQVTSGDLAAPPSGATNLLIVADAGNAVAEPDETNNVLALSFGAVANPPPPPGTIATPPTPSPDPTPTPPVSSQPVSSPPPATPPPSGPGVYAVGAGAGAQPRAQLYAANGSVLLDVLAYDPSFTGGVRVAAADVTGDGTPDLITAAGPGGGPHVKVFDGKTGALVSQFYAYDAGFTGGVFVAAGDVTGDGTPDIVTGAGAGGGPHVKAFDGRTGQEVRSFFAYDPGFTGGVTVAAGDVNGDGFADIITGAGAGGGPHVKAFSGKDGSVLLSFFAYDAGFTGGVNVAAGDADGDGRADIITGAGVGGGPHVRVFRGVDGTLLSEFMAGDPNSTAGVRVAAADLDGDGKADVIAAGNDIRTYDSKHPGQPSVFLLTDMDVGGGVFVG